MTRYPKGLLEYVTKNYKNMTLQELTNAINTQYGTHLTKKAVSSMKKRYGLKGAPRQQVYSKTFPEEVCRFIEKHHKGTGHQAMADLLKREMGLKYSKEQIKTFYHNHGLNSGITGHFEKGKPSHNKGVPMSPEVYEKAKATMFKKGQRPHNAVPVGTVVLATIGYYKVKVAEPDVWEFCHVKAWEEHYGKVPEGSMVSFKDGNREDWSIENLMLVTRQENSYMNHGLRFEQRELTEAGLNIAKVKVAARNARKRRKDGQAH